MGWSLGCEERWGEFILSGRDCARPRYHSSVAKLLLSTFLIMNFKKRTKSTQNVKLLLFVILFIFVKLSFLSPPFLKFPFPSKIEKNDSDSQSVLRPSFLAFDEIETKWEMDKRSWDISLILFLVPASRKSILHHLPTCCPRKRLWCSLCLLL